MDTDLKSDLIGIKSNENFSSISSEAKYFKTSLSGKTRFPIFNFYSFNLGDIKNDDPSNEIIFKAFKVHEVKGKQTTEEIGCVKVAQACLHL